MLLVHGSPRRNNEDILPDLPIKKVEEILEGTDADIIFAVIHIFHAGIRQARNRLWLM